MAEESSSSRSVVLSSNPEERSIVEDEAVVAEASRWHAKELIFVGKGNLQPSKYIIIPKETEKEVKNFADSFLLRGLEKSTEETKDNFDDSDNSFFSFRPEVLISVTGGAQDFYMHSSKLEQVFNRGMLRAAKNTKAWIIDGGLDAGVMQYVGKAVREGSVADVPCIGIATHKMVLLNEMLSESLDAGRDRPAEYVANQPNTPNKCALNPNHTHFILVNTPSIGWGQEILFRSELEKYIRDKFHIPLVQIVVNGGPGTLETVGEAAKNNFAIVVVQGSGRACDAIAALVRRARVNEGLAEKVEFTVDGLTKALRDDTVDLSPWQRLLAEAKGDQKKIAIWTGFMNKILENYKAITLFNVDDEASADMDIFILRAILSSPGQKLSLGEKLKFGVDWNRSDIINEIIDTEKDALSSRDHRDGLNKALEQSLLQDRAEIFTILANKGAQKDTVNLKKLYFYKDTKSYFRKIPAYALGKSTATKSGSNKAAEEIPLESSQGLTAKSEFSKDTERARNAIKMVFKTVGGAFYGYQEVLDDKFDSVEKLEGLLPNVSVSKSGTIKKKKKRAHDDEGVSVSYTDFMIWSIIVNRFELAKAIWRKTSLPVHSALLACQLYRFLAEFSSDKPTLIENSDWFEQEAIKIIDFLEYEDVKNTLEWKWKEMGNRSALEIAEDAEGKKFVGHQHVQTLLDEMFYSDRYGKIDATTTSFRIWATIVLPIPLVFGLYKNTILYERKPWLFYHLPIVKFWTNTLFYCGFLFLQAYVLCNLNFEVSHDFLNSEIVLWVWIAALILEEIMQFSRDAGNHFEHLSNQMDFLVLLLHIVYMVLRWSSYREDGRFHVFSAAVNTLIVACIFSWGRLLNVFAINHALGPLFFVIIRLFKDIFLWIFVFVIFAISFQLGFVNITMQAHMDSKATYPTGTLPVSFFAIIGEWTYITEDTSTEWDDTPLGIALLSIYALISQVMLVNLLIAMMGDTYSNVSENSMEEWKFYRLEMVMENQMTSFHPPPVNLVIVPFEIITHFRQISAKTHRLFSSHKEGQKLMSTQEISNSSLDNPDIDEQRVIRKMRWARDEIIAQEEHDDVNAISSIVAGVKEKLRTLANERENDRTFTEKRFKELEAVIRAGGAGGAGGPAPIAGGDVANLQQAQQQIAQYQQQLNTQQQQLAAQSQQLSQQNQQILSLLQQQQLWQLQVQEQLQQIITRDRKSVV